VGYFFGFEKGGGQERRFGRVRGKNSFLFFGFFPSKTKQNKV